MTPDCCCGTCAFWLFIEHGEANNKGRWGECDYNTFVIPALPKAVQVKQTKMRKQDGVGCPVWKVKR